MSNWFWSYSIVFFLANSVSPLEYLVFYLLRMHIRIYECILHQCSLCWWWRICQAFLFISIKIGQSGHYVWRRLVLALLSLCRYITTHDSDLTKPSAFWSMNLHFPSEDNIFMSLYSFGHHWIQTDHRTTDQSWIA